MRRHGGRRGGRQRERGAALIVVLWGVALIAAAIVAIGVTSRSESLIGRNAVENARARHAAEAAVQLALHRLLSYPRGTRLFDGTPTIWHDGTTTVALSIQDEEGKIDLNAASFDLIAGVLRGAGLDRDTVLAIACRIVARRGVVDPQCLEGDAPPPAVEPGLMVAVEEARRVIGVGDALYRRLLPLITAFSGSAAVDPRVAPRDVLLAVPSLSASSVDSYLGRRALADGLGDLRDRRYFAVTTGRTFAISAVATTAAGGRHRAEMFVRLTWRPEQPFAVLAWREPAG